LFAAFEFGVSCAATLQTTVAIVSIDPNIRVRLAFIATEFAKRATVASETRSFEKANRKTVHSVALTWLDRVLIA
jgi:hypothetical protein